MKVGVLASELMKVIAGRPLEALGNPEVTDLASKALMVVKSLGLGCAEFAVGFKELEAVSKATAKEGSLDISVHESEEGSAARLSYIDEAKRMKVLEALKATVDYASSGVMRVLTVHPASFNPFQLGYGLAGETHEYFGREEARKASMDGLRDLARYALKRGLALGLENAPLTAYFDGVALKVPRLGVDRSEFLSILSGVQNGLSVTFDVGHANTVCEPSAYAEGLVCQFSHVHLHDNDGACDQHRPLGSGTVKLDALFKALKEEGYSQSIVLERPVDAALLDDIAKLRRYVSRADDLT